MYVYIYIYIYIDIYLSISLSLSIYIYIYIFSNYCTPTRPNAMVSVRPHVGMSCMRHAVE